MEERERAVRVEVMWEVRRREAEEVCELVELNRERVLATSDLRVLFPSCVSGALAAWDWTLARKSLSERERVRREEEVARADSEVGGGREEEATEGGGVLEVGGVSEWCLVAEWCLV